MDKKFSAIVLCAGSSSRMGKGRSKLMEKIKGKTVFERTLTAFESSLYVFSVTIVCRKKEEKELRSMAETFRKVSAFVSGGATRQESVLNSLAQNTDSDYFVIHDGARPLITPEEIDMVCKEALEYGASALAAPAKDTFKRIDDKGFIGSTVPRENLWHVQTPQVFKRDLYLEAVEKAKAEDKDFTDDCQLIENLGGKVHLVKGSHKNMKITTPEDIISAGAFIKGDNMRIGHGYDVHKLVPGRKLILGGIEIPYEMGLLGHSDADVLLHAISDALLGAAALGDIGKHFPDTDEKYRNADSMVLLKTVVSLLKEKGYSIDNIDATIVMQKPKLAPYMDAIRENISAGLNLEKSFVNVKATTEEGLGFTGNSSAAAAHAVCLISAD